MEPTIKDGLYFLSPEGSAWIAARIKNGCVISMTEEANQGTHAAARDEWAGIHPNYDDDAVLNDDEATAIVSLVMGDDADSELVEVSRPR